MAEPRRIARSVGVDAQADVKFVIGDHGSADGIGLSGSRIVSLFLTGMAAELPDQLAGLRFEAVYNGVAARENDLRLALHDGQRGIGPLAFYDIFAGKIVLPGELAIVLVQGDEAGR